VRHTRRSRQVAEAQMNFVGNVSHELRTPLTVIRGAAHNLQRPIVQEPERIGEYSGLIVQHAERLDELVEQVLEFNRQKRRAIYRLLDRAQSRGQDAQDEQDSDHPENLVNPVKNQGSFLGTIRK